MGIISFFKRRRTENTEELKELKAQRVERPGIKLRLKNPKKNYRATVVLVFKGKPMSQMYVDHSGYSRDLVAAELDKDLSLKLHSVVQLKPKRPSPHTKQSPIPKQ